jgi:predicted PurR-regulated permease PerM
MERELGDVRTENGRTPDWGIGSTPQGGSHGIISAGALGVIVVICAILYVARDLFLPLALGMLFAFILAPLVNRLRRLGLPDAPAVLITVLATASLVASFILVVAYQLSQIGANLPQYQGNVLTKMDSLLDAGQESQIVARLQQMVNNIAERVAEASPSAGSDGGATETVKVEVVQHSSVTDWVSGAILPILGPIAVFGLIAVVVVFALLERASLRGKLVQLIGGTNIPASSRLLAEAGARVSTYLVAQLLVNVIYAVPIGLGLWLIGVPNALFFGIVTLVMRFVPYIGSAISAILPLVMAFAVSPDWSLVLWTGALFLVVEAITSNVIEPRFYGQRTGVSPLAVIISAMFWTWLWGSMGLIIATPLTVCLVVIGLHVPGLRLFAILLGDKPVHEASQLYDRLLTGHSFAISDLATMTTGERYLSEYYDGTAIPALARAQADFQAGLLSESQQARVAQAAVVMIEDLETVVEDELTQGANKQAIDAAPDNDSDTTVLNNGLLDGVGRRIAIIPARTRLEEVVAAMIAQALRAEGAETRIMPQRVALLRSAKPTEDETIVLTSLDVTDWTALELQVRQLRRRYPTTRIGVALWPGGSEALSSQDHQSKKRFAGADFVSLGMGELMSGCFEPVVPAAKEASATAVVVDVGNDAQRG